ncbi:unnamed protein product [Mycena citricolor]|uniref:N-acetyltransferase domain-containing protein n=1 Tax=Mycena citricolor TaxID=2018698 RepID=A0AAD2HVL1_9AGAR|nr:unnamed protein product [Mycena citricolor]CAK5282106.1 unnamed protein product [Mycena citricolor]
MSGSEIRIRPFRPEDKPEIRRLMIEGFVSGPLSPCVEALKHNLTTPTSFLLYLSASAGAGLCLAPSTSHKLRILGLALSSCSVGIFLFIRRGIRQFFLGSCERAEQTDFNDIGEWYDTNRGGPGGFFVAAFAQEGREDKVVGFVGMDCKMHPDPHTAELRRMVVSPFYRRQRIAGRLLEAAVEHAKTHSIATLEIETSQHQPGAKRLYEKFGFRAFLTKRLSLGPLGSMQVWRLRKTVGESIMAD